ncbi:hypothetical protein MANES_13G087401v8 [Manihot esculenta]|uniref:Uncharacterized protein n=1 Tax=Manihot esculenta TaxID=3983 RepID=A0ACB7GKA7_MANES|nr:hypothetical protein MANES_13G087401v8 [Manihot esculenta]
MNNAVERQKGVMVLRFSTPNLSEISVEPCRTVQHSVNQRPSQPIVAH